MAVRQRVVAGDEITHVVLDGSFRVVEPIERYLEHLRQEKYSPHTVRSYAGGLAAWWTMLEEAGTDWSAVEVDDLVRFMRRLQTGQAAPGVPLLRPVKPSSSSTVESGLTAVMSFYRYHAVRSGVPAARSFYEYVKGGTVQARSRYTSFLGHVRDGHERRIVGRRRGRKKPVPFLTPGQIERAKDDAATSLGDGSWRGDLRFRLFWSLLEGTGLRIAEALLLKHGDWIPGTGTTAAIQIRPREDAQRRLRVKNQQYRHLYIGDDLDDLYGEYLFWLADRGVDFDDRSFVFVNLFRCHIGSPMRPENVYDWVDGFRRRHPLLPRWTPHWFRHTHATAMLLAGVREHVVQRRLGHSDINTLMTTYAHVTDDAEMKAAADWSSLIGKWKAAE
ncbi:tyrosine-type recombinase/integrase [Sinomonas humi]|uniref:Transposase n=1 Tax=Sinomonas humi TaxID=1338436 RepID=A0A0B2ALX7_9MICC|nr:tyrosine-type recombinase/integrase [Sinomonas humi]KHL04652.1 hypothetical protein LK10_04390 [Sinomonas humi]